MGGGDCSGHGAFPAFIDLEPVPYDFLVSRPLDDMPGKTIARRAKAVRGEVTDEPARTRPEPPDDGPSDEDVERFSDVTVKCPECGTEVLDEVEVCWKCGHAIHERERFRQIPLWTTVIAILLIVAMLLWMILPRPFP